jgi:hypothetical protein
MRIAGADALSKEGLPPGVGMQLVAVNMVNIKYLPKGLKRMEVIAKIVRQSQAFGGTTFLPSSPEFGSCRTSARIAEGRIQARFVLHMPSAR